MLTQRQIDQVAKKNVENIVRKASEGKTLSQKEIEVLSAQAAMLEDHGDAERLPGEKLCEITTLSDRRHRQLADEGYFPPPINGVYQLTPTLQGIVRYLRDQATKAESNMEEEKLKKLIADRRLAELDLQKKRKDALDAESVFNVWEGILLTIRQKLLALPSKLAPRLVYVDEQAEIEQELEREVSEALIDLSKPVTYQNAEEDTGDSAEIIQEGDSESAKSPQAATKAKRS
jgi:hypothetical protein